MWKIEIAYKYSSIVCHLLFDTEEQAETERQKLLPYIGKDLYDLNKNGNSGAISLIDKFGTIDVAPLEVKAVRKYHSDEWDEYVTQRNAETEIKIANKKKELGG